MYIANIKYYISIISILEHYMYSIMNCMYYTKFCCRVMKIKELVGFWVNDDPRRYVVAEPVSVMATNFGGTSFSPGAISWAEQGMHFMFYPKATLSYKPYI